MIDGKRDMESEGGDLEGILTEMGPTRLLRLAWLKTRRAARRRSAAPVGWSLALQGGGALGAFTWGALDRLSREKNFRVAAISGASAGALNGAVFLSGLAKDGPAGARKALQSFWSEVSNAASLASLVTAPIFVGARMMTVAHAMIDRSRMAARPYSSGALREILARHVDIGALRSARSPRLYVSATHVRTASARIFSNEEMSLDTLLASACLPSLHETVRIDGEDYWDGGYTANPALTPIADDPGGPILLVRLIRAGAEKAPRETSAIDDYLKALMFARPLEDEIDRIVDLTGRRIKEIDASRVVEGAAMSSEPTPGLVRRLFSLGEAAAEEFLREETRRAADGPPALFAQPEAAV